MKKMKNLVVIAIAIIMLSVFSSTLFASKVLAATNYWNPADKVPVSSTSPYEFNASEFLSYYSDVQLAGNENLVLRQRMDITGKTAIPVKQYDENGTLLNMESDQWHDGIITAKDASAILCLQRGFGREDDIPTQNEMQSTWEGEVNDIICSLIAGTQGLTADKILVTVNVKTPKVQLINNSEEKYSISSTTKFERAVVGHIMAAEGLNEDYYKAKNQVTEIQHRRDVQTLQLVSVTVTTTDGDEYKMVLATDNNFYLIKTEVTPDPEPTVLKFETELTYKAMIGTVDVGYTMNKITCIPNYDKNNIKKDADVTAIITSTTDLDILTVDGVEVGLDKDHANADGWYYIDSTDKKVIAKLYPFEKFNNLDDNGTVVYDKDDVENNHRGSVKVVLGSIKDEDDVTLTSEENVSIQWPFRIIEVTQDPQEVTEATDKVTVTITTNLPMDKDYLEKNYPGWAFTDTALGKSQHQIYKVYERKNGDVEEKIIVKENGRTDLDNTTVKIKWPASTGKKLEESQTGVFMSSVIIAIIGAGAFAITRYYKLKK